MRRRRWSFAQVKAVAAKELIMLDPEERALIADLKDRIIVLMVEQRHAHRAGNDARADDLQGEIDRLSAECEDIRSAAEN